MDEHTSKRRGSDLPKDSASPTRDEVMAYVADMCRELASISRQQGQERVAVLLDMARNEVGGAAIKH